MTWRRDWGFEWIGSCTDNLLTLSARAQSEDQVGKIPDKKMVHSVEILIATLTILIAQ